MNQQFNLNTNKEKLFYYLLIILFGLVQYLVQIGTTIEYFKNIVPSGDSFTYELGHYIFLDEIQNQSLFDNIKKLISGQWYWQQRLLIMIFEFFLTKKTFSLNLINFASYTLSSTVIFYFLNQINKNKFFENFILSISIWIFPINYHFFDYGSLLNHGLDSIFLSSLYILFCSIILLTQNYKKKNFQILFIIGYSFSLFSRGNSLPIIIIFSIIPFLFMVYKNKGFSFLKDLKLLITFIFFISVIFYYFNIKSLLFYYGDFNFKTNPEFYNYFFSFIKNIPGIFFEYPHKEFQDLMAENNLFIIFLSFSFHGLFFYRILKYALNKKIKIDEKNIIEINCIFIYFFFLLYGSIVWNTPHINLYNALIIWEPMKIAISFVMIIFFTNLINKKKFFLYVILFLITLLVPKIFQNIYFKLDKKYYIGVYPEKILNLSIYLSNHRNYQPIILYTEPNFISNRLIDFYLLQRNQKSISWYRSKYADEIWNPTKESDEFKLNVYSELENIFSNSKLIILPQNSEAYLNKNKNNLVLHAFYRYNYMITDILKKNNLKNFKVIDQFKTKKTNLLILKKGNQVKNFRLSFVKDKYFINLISKN